MHGPRIALRAGMDTMMCDEAVVEQRHVRDGISALEERACVEGVGSLTTEELLAVLLGSGRHRGDSMHTSRELLERFPLWRLPWCRVRELAPMAELGRSKAVQLLCALELGQRAARMPLPERARLSAPEDVAALCAPRMAALPRERVVALMCDRKQRLLAEAVVAEGWAEGCHVDPREVFRPALAERASGVILVHNHPSGDPTPSATDRDLTHRLSQAGALLGIKLVDHVVVALGGFASLAGQGCCC